MFILRMQETALCNFIADDQISGLPRRSGYIPILIFFIFFFPGVSSVVSAQSESTDSSFSQLKSQTPSDQYNALLEIAFSFVDKDNRQSLYHIEEAHQIAKSLGDTTKIVKSGRIKGQLLRRLDRIEDAIIVFTDLLPIAKRNNLYQDYYIILNSLAVAHTDRGAYDKALQYNFESLELREREGNRGDISISLENIGRVYYKLKDYSKAIEYYKRSIQLKKESNSDLSYYVTLINLAHCYKVLYRFDEAIDYFNEGLELCGDACPPNIKIDAEYGLGVTYMLQKQLHKAKGHLHTSYEMALLEDDKRFQAENLILLSQIGIEQSEYDSAFRMLKRAEAITQSADYIELLKETYRHFSTLYKQQADYEKASLYQDKYIQLKDSLFSDGLIKSIASIQTKIEERENIKTIATQDEALERQRTLNIAIAIIAILTALLGFMLYRNNVARRRANERLDKEVQTATQDLQAANQLLAEVNKELDHFIYKTSHDIRGPLATLKGLCNVALSDVNDPTALSYLNKLDFTASQLDTLLRRLQKINQINNAPLHANTIDFNEIVDYVELIEKRKGMPPRLTIMRDIQGDISFTSDLELVTLIMENLIANAIKFHDNSDRANPFVKVMVRATKSSVVIRVLDNGIGIGEVHPEELFHIFARASERSVSGGIGLYLSRRASQKLGGHIDLHATSEGFTEVIVTLPLAGVELQNPAVKKENRNEQNAQTPPVAKEPH